MNEGLLLMEGVILIEWDILNLCQICRKTVSISRIY